MATRIREESSTGDTEIKRTRTTNERRSKFVFFGTGEDVHVRLLVSKEISSRTEPLQQSLDSLTKELTAKLDPLTQSVKAIKDSEQRMSLFWLFHFFSADLDHSPKPANVPEEIDKALQPFTQIVRTLKDSKD